MGKPLSRSHTKSKAQQKFEKKVQFYERVGETIATLNAQKTITKKKKLRSKRELKAFDLSALSESLPGLEASEQKSSAAKSLKVNCKSRLKFILKELKQMVRVLSQSKFQADPLGSIQLYLETTQPVEELKRKKRNINGSKKRKEEKLKASARPSPMEMCLISHHSSQL